MLADVKSAYPWDLDKSPFKGYDKRYIEDKLSSTGFDMNIKKPDDATIVKLDKLLEGFFGQDALNWAVVFSNDMTFLSHLALAIPVAFSMSTKRRSFVTTTDKLFHNFLGAIQASKNYEFEQMTREQRYAENVKEAGLLVWEQLSVSSAGSIKYSGKYSSILQHRQLYNLPTIFTVHSPKISAKKVNIEQFFSGIATKIGDTNADHIKQSSMMIWMMVKPKKVTLVNMGDM